MVLCNKSLFIKSLGVNVGCILERGHKAGHIANLQGRSFGKYVVLRQAESQVCSRSGGGKIRRTQWIISDGYSERIVLASSLIAGNTSGKNNISGLSSTPEYTTICNHARWIAGKAPFKACYHNMPFYDGWNPEKGGSYLAAYDWIIANLGQRPSQGWSLDIIKHELGFVPGNLRWALRKSQQDNKQHRVLGQFSEEEFAAEAKRRGYVKGDCECQMQLQLTH
jgi:hypothetical protein